MAVSCGLLLLLLSARRAHSTPAPLHDFSLERWCPDAATRFYAQTFGAVGDGVANDGPAIQNAIDSASAAAGGCAVLTLGVFNTGGLLMKSHSTLFIDITASLRGSTNGSHWIAQYEAVTAMGGNTYNDAGRLIGGYAAHNIAIVGEGVVDGQVQQYLTGVGGKEDNGVDGGGPDEFSYRYLHVPGYGRTRPGVLALSNSVNVTVAGVQVCGVLALDDRAGRMHTQLPRTFSIRGLPLLIFSSHLLLPGPLFLVSI